jgi:hypothetical protein
MDLKIIGWQGVEWIHLAQSRDQLLALMNTAVKFQAL